MRELLQGPTFSSSFHREQYIACFYVRIERSSALPSVEEVPGVAATLISEASVVVVLLVVLLVFIRVS